MIFRLTSSFDLAIDTWYLEFRSGYGYVKIFRLAPSFDQAIDTWPWSPATVTDLFMIFLLALGVPQRLRTCL